MAEFGTIVQGAGRRPLEEGELVTVDPVPERRVDHVEHVAVLGPESPRTLLTVSGNLRRVRVDRRADNGRPSNGDVLSFIDKAIDKAKETVDDVATSVRDGAAAEREKGETDVEADPHVAGARDGDDGDDGEFVGRTNPAFDAEVQQSGAEARSEAARDSG